MYAKQLKELKLDEHDKIGFTLKTLGAGFWALTQHDFRRALTDLVMEVVTPACTTLTPTQGGGGLASARGNIITSPW